MHNDYTDEMYHAACKILDTREAQLEYYNDVLCHKKGVVGSFFEGLRRGGESMRDSMYENDHTSRKKSDVDTRQALAEERLRNSRLQRDAKNKRDEEILATLAANIGSFLKNDGVISVDEDKQIKDILRNTNYVDYRLNNGNKSIVFITRNGTTKVFPL